MQRRLKLAGHSQHHPELVAQKVILWQPIHGHSKKERHKFKYTFIDGLRDDTGLKDAKEIGVLIQHRELWRKLSNNIREIKHPT